MLLLHLLHWNRLKNISCLKIVWCHLDLRLRVICIRVLINYLLVNWNLNKLIFLIHWSVQAVWPSELLSWLNKDWLKHWTWSWHRHRILIRSSSLVFLLLKRWNLRDLLLSTSLSFHCEFLIKFIRKELIICISMLLLRCLILIRRYNRLSPIFIWNLIFSSWGNRIRFFSWNESNLLLKLYYFSQC